MHLRTPLYRYFSFIGIACLLAVLYARHVDAAVINIETQPHPVRVGETFLAVARIDSEQEVINVVQGKVKYPTDILEVIDVSRGGSFLTLWPDPPSVDAEAGEISFTGGIPQGSMVFDGIVLTITFRATSPGGGEVEFLQDGTRVLLNDGKGTDAPVENVSGLISIVEEETVTLYSPTHPDENTWYPKRTLTVQWSPNTDTLYSYHITQSPGSLPDSDQDPMRGEAQYSDLTDGVHYFMLKEQPQNGNWRLVAIRRVLVDTTPPLQPEVEIGSDASLFGGKEFLAFSSQDTHSGIRSFAVVEGDAVTQEAASPYELRDQSGTSALQVIAYDKAGNASTTVVRQFDTVQESRYSSAQLFIFSIMLLVISATLFYIVRSKVLTHPPKSI
ncbi:MAG: cohesin domain-containing protein [Parcubacteria group bacterium]